MSGLKEIKNRIVSVKNTQQITKAMNMVSASKLRRVQSDLIQSRPYANHLQQLIRNVAASAKNDAPASTLDESAPPVSAFILITSDKGLCGGLNNNLNKKTLKFLENNKAKFDKTDLYCFGKKGTDFFKKRGYSITESALDIKESAKIGHLAGMVNRVFAAFEAGKLAELYIGYTQFNSVISHSASIKKLLPFDDVSDDGENTEYIFEPGAKQVFESLLPKYVQNAAYVALLESIASEHGARMSAMDSATRNAGEMISKLSLTYNRARQAAITTELTEIISGAESIQ